MKSLHFWACCLSVSGFLFFASCSSQQKSPFEKEYEKNEEETAYQFFERVEAELDTADRLNVDVFSEWHIAEGKQALFFVLSDTYGYGITPYLLVPIEKEGRYRLFQPETPETSFFRDAYGSLRFETPEAADLDGDGINELKVEIISTSTGDAAEEDGMVMQSTSFGEVLTFKNNNYLLDAGLSEVYNRMLREENAAAEKEKEEAEKRIQAEKEREMAALLSSYPADIHSREQMKEILLKTGLASEQEENSDNLLHTIGKDEVKGFFYNPCDDQGWSIISTGAASDHEAYPIYAFSYQDISHYKIVNMENNGARLTFTLEALNYNLEPSPETSYTSPLFSIYRVGKSWVIEVENTNYTSYLTSDTYLDNFRRVEEECDEEEY